MATKPKKSITTRGPTAPVLTEGPAVTSSDNQYRIEFSVRSSPKPTVTWSKNGRSIPLSNKRIKTKLDGLVPNFVVSLVITDFDETQDPGEYKCTLKNSLGSIVVSAVLAKVEASKPEPVEKRKETKIELIEDKVQFNPVRKCAEVSITCQVDSESEPKVKWFRDNKALGPPDYNEDSLFEQGTWTFYLEIMKISPNIKGKYKITVEFADVGKSEKLFNISEAKGKEILEVAAKQLKKPEPEPEPEPEPVPEIVEESVPVIQGVGDQSEFPIFIQYPENKTMTSLKTDLVEAIVAGNPFPTIKWYKGRNELAPGIKYNFSIDTKTGKATLEIVRPKSDDEGQYTMKIFNKHGEDSSQFNIYVQDASSATLDFRGKLRRLSSSSDRASVASVMSLGTTDGSDTREDLPDGSKDDRKRSLANVIPDWPALRKAKVTLKEKDRWVKPLENCQFNESDGTATLIAVFCKSGGILRWYKNRVEIFHGKKYQFISHGGEQKLIIKKLHPDDSGRYICSINDIETTCWLEVQAAKIQYDFYKQLPVKMEVFRTKTTILECHVNHPTCPVIWMRNKKTIREGEKGLKMYVDSTRRILRIQRTQKSDEAVYTCQIKDDPQKITTCYLYVLEPQWRFSVKLPPEINGNEHDNTMLEVEVEDLEAECEWFYRGELITEETDPSKYRFETDGLIRRMFIIDSDPKKDSGKYECRTGVMSSQTNVHIIPALRFTKPLQDCSVSEGSEIRLEFALNAKKNIVSWTKNDTQTLLPTERIFIANEGMNHWLSIKNAVLDDYGTYKATVEGLETSCNVTVHEAPTAPSFVVGKIPKKITVKVGDPISINIPFKGFPIPSCMWWLNGKQVDSKLVKVDEDKKVCTLEIPQSKITDSGTYTLKLSNNVGQVEAKIPVVVLDKPGRPEGPITVHGTTKSSCTFSWEPPREDGGTPVLHYIVERLDNQTKQWVNVDKIAANERLQCTVKGLNENEKVHFRVSAVNQIGTSDYLQTVKPVLIKDEAVAPSAPSKPTVIDSSCDNVTLKWEIPKRDGGAPITMYVVEMKEGKTGSWTKSVEIPASKVDKESITANIPHLQEKTEYEFRIKAHNRVGEGEASESSGKVVTPARKFAPVIENKNLKPLVLKVKDKLLIEYNYRAEPQPEVTWKFDDKVISPDDKRIKVKTSEGRTQLIIDEVDRSNAGRYSVTLENEVGRDYGHREVDVKGPPSPPVGPLVVSDVQKNKVTLSWNPPADDGGYLVTNYTVERQDEETGKWLPVTDTVSGTQFTVRKLQKGHSYQFRVRAENSLGLSEPLSTTTATIAKDPFDPPEAPPKPIVVSRDRSSIEIQWDRPEDDGGAPIRGYYVERYNPVSNRWKRLNTDLVDSTKFNDKTVVANQEYKYRVIAVNSAGEGEPSEATELVIAKPEKETPSIDVSNIPKVYGRNEIRIRAGERASIELPIGGIPTPTCTWSRENMDIHPDERFGVDNSEDKTKLTLFAAKRADTGEYKITVQNEAGKAEETIKVIVLDVPSAFNGPINVQNIDNSSVELSWDVPGDDGGSPITGYKIEKCAENGNWEPCDDNCPFPRIRVKDLDNSVKYKFRVQAINKYGCSEPIETEFITVKPPYDTPSAPRNTHVVEVDEHCISLSWDIPESDGGNPIEGYDVEMREKDGSWRKINKRIVRTPNFSCFDVEAGKEYDFRVRAVNQAGAGEPGRSTGLTKAERPICAPSSPPTPRILGTTKSSVTLGINPPSDDGGSKIIGYVVEKLIDDGTGGEWAEAKRISPDDTSVVVDGLSEGKDYSFRVRAINAVGEGEPSERTKFVTAEDEPEAPSFLDTDEGPKRIVVRAGEPINIEIPYRGNPKPFAALDRDDEALFDSDKLKPEVLDDKVLITCDAAKRPLTGKYNVSLKNRLGKAQLPIEIIVQDKPGKPQGPLKTSVIDGKKCVLEWKPPADDGGSEITGYKIEKRLAGTDAWIPAAPLVRPNSNRCEVTDVDVGNRYDFRVLAVNEFGEGDALETDHTVKIQLPYKTPGTVGKIECKLRSPESIEIEWPRPENDGGSPITGYVVEMKSASDDKWIPLSNRRSMKTEATATGLTEGERYTFRVAAVNEAGIGDWREAREYIEARLPDEPPTMYGFEEGPKEIRVKQGQPFHLRIPFTASPTPTAIVTKGGDQITDNDFLNVKVEDGQVLLDCKNASLKHEGNYTCTLTNPCGSVSGQIKLVVLGPPGPPTGPIKASNCTPDGCVLTWQPPENDGGDEVSNYVVEMMDTRDGNWVSLAKCCRSPSYEVYGLKPGHSYKYRVMAQNINGISEPLETSQAVLADYPFKVPSSPNCLDANNITESSVTLQWNRPSNDGGSTLQGYRVEMRRAKDDEWIPLNVDLLEDTSLVVQNLRPDESYDFRVVAKNDAGFSDAATLLKPVKTKRKAARPSAPSAPQVLSVAKDSVEIEWDAPVDDGGSPVKSYIVEKREANNPHWEQACPEPVLDRKCIVPELRENSKYEFRVRALNAVGQSEPSQESVMTKVGEYITDGEAPSFTRPLSQVSVAPNHSAEFNVEFTGNPAPSVKWYKNEIQILPGSRFITKEDTNKATLMINQVLDTDNASELKCVIENPLGQDQTQCILNVTKPPRIDIYPVNQVAREGDSVRVKIPITSTTPVKCSVWKNGEKFYKDDDRLKVTTSEDFVIVNIPKCNEDTEGSYKVSIENDAGSATANFDIKVLRTPSAPYGPLTVSDVTKSSCTLSWRPPADDGNCKVSHYVVEKMDMSEPNPQWTTVPMLIKDNQAELTNLPSDHQFMFKVKAVNSQGEGQPLTTDEPIQLKNAYGTPMSAGRPELLSMEDGKINLQWPRSRQTGAPQAGYFLEIRPADGSSDWYRVNPDTPFTNNKAAVGNLEEGQKYEFRVIAVNDSGEGEPSDTSEPIKFYDDTIVEKPTITSPLQNQKVKEGNSVTFTVEANGRPKPIVKWYKDDLEIDDDSKYEITSDGDVHTLKIYDVMPDDAGQYSVKVKNVAGTKTSKAVLKVESRPKIRLPAIYERPVSFMEDQPVEIKIPLVCQEIPDVEWTFNGKPLKNDDRYEIDTTETSAILRIKKGSKDDTGRYDLKVSNSIGSDDVTVNLNIIGVPEPPRHVKVENAEDELVTVSWGVPLNNGGDEITKYIVESKINEPNATWNKIAYSRLPRCTLENLKSNTQYQFRVVAENVNGRSVPCEPTGIVTTGDSALEKSKKRKTPYGLDEDGRPIRGLQGYAPKDYDKCYTDCWSQGKPSPAFTSSSPIYDSYDIFEELGGSQFGTSHRSVDRRTGKNYVSTFIRTNDDAEKKTVKEQIETMTKLVHPKLLNLHEVFQDKDEYTFTTEFLSGENLLDRFSNKSSRQMTEADAINYVRQICQALKYMHENNYVHLNVKPESAVFTTKKSDELKLVDFNLASKLAPNKDVSVSLESTEFAAPEIVNGDDVGFYTDMWAVGVLTYLMLAGKSPFGADEQTRRKIMECNVEFPEGFDNISDEAKDFIKHLLVKDKTGRMTAQEALDHPWLTSNVNADNNVLRPDKYKKEEEYLQRRRVSYQPQVLEIGRISSYSNLRNHQPVEYNIRKTKFDRREAYPRFLMGLRNVYVLEGDNAEFNCRIVSASPFTVNWYNQYGQEIKQSTKYSKRSEGNMYTLEIRKCSDEDKGLYKVTASNSFGEKSMERSLFVQTIPQPVKGPTIRRATPIRHLEYNLAEVWEEKDSGPKFTYQLRPRVVSEGQSVKLTCTVSGKPTPKISWFKDKANLDMTGPNYTITNEHGVCTLELTNARAEDSGWYKCLAENKAGYAETSCQILVLASRMRFASTDSRQQEGSTYTSREEIVYSDHRGSRQSIAQFSEETFKSLQPSDSPPQISMKRRSSTRPPHVEEFLSDTTVYEGSVLQLRCAMTDRVPPTVTWYKNGEPIGPSDHIRTEFDGHIATLTIDEAISSDAGMYKLEISNDVSCIEMEAEVVVKGRDSSIVGRTSIDVRTIDDNQEQTEEIHLNDQQIEEKEKKPAETKIETKHDNLRFVKFLTSQFLNEEDTLRLSCDVEGSGDFDIEWTRNGKSVPMGKDFERGRNDKHFYLQIDEVLPEDSGLFSAEIKDIQSGQSIKCNCTVIIKAEGKVKDPQIEMFPQSCSVSAGQTAKFVCKTKSKSQLSGIWYLNGKVVKEDGNHKIRYDKVNKQFELEINNVSPNDQGMYRLDITKPLKKEEVSIVCDLYVTSEQ